MWDGGLLHRGEGGVSVGGSSVGGGSADLEILLDAYLHEIARISSALRSLGVQLDRAPMGLG